MVSSGAGDPSSTAILPVMSCVASRELGELSSLSGGKSGLIPVSLGSYQREKFQAAFPGLSDALTQPCRARLFSSKCPWMYLFACCTWGCLRSSFRPGECDHDCLPYSRWPVTSPISWLIRTATEKILKVTVFFLTLSEGGRQIVHLPLEWWFLIYLRSWILG